MIRNHQNNLYISREVINKMSYAPCYICYVPCLAVAHHFWEPISTSICTKLRFDHRKTNCYETQNTGNQCSKKKKKKTFVNLGEISCIFQNRFRRHLKYTTVMNRHLFWRRKQVIKKNSDTMYLKNKTLFIFFSKTNL